jgi:hypothetical protein
VGVDRQRHQREEVLGAAAGRLKTFKSIASAMA